MKKLFLFSLLLSGILYMAACDLGDPVGGGGTDGITGKYFVENYTTNGIFGRPGPADTIFVEFKENGIIEGRGYGKCTNRFSGTYSVEIPGKISVSQLGSTEMACMNSIYWAVVQLLPYARSYVKNERMLIFVKTPEGKEERIALVAAK